MGHQSDSGGIECTIARSMISNHGSWHDLSFLASALDQVPSARTNIKQQPGEGSQVLRQHRADLGIGLNDQLPHVEVVRPRAEFLLVREQRIKAIQQGC